MGFLSSADTKYAKTVFVQVHSVAYLKGAHIKKMTTADIIEMSSKDVEKDDEKDDGLEKVIEFLVKYVHDDEKKPLDATEAFEFFKQKPIGDLIKLQSEILKVSGASVDVDELKKK